MGDNVLRVVTHDVRRRTAYCCTGIWSESLLPSSRRLHAPLLTPGCQRSKHGDKQIKILVTESSNASPLVFRERTSAYKEGDMGLEISKFAERLGICLIAACCIGSLARAEEPESTSDDSSGQQEATVNQNAHRMIHEGRRTFRFDTFEDEAFWGDTLKLHQAIEGERFGGGGPGVSPRTALAVGLKVDLDAVPSALGRQLRRRGVDLDDVPV